MAGPFFALQPLAKPRPAKPTSSIAQVEGSRTAVAEDVSGSPFVPPWCSPYPNNGARIVDPHSFGVAPA